MNRRRLALWIFLPALLLLLPGLEALGSVVERFPPPDLGDDYLYPQSSQAEARAGWLAWVDTFALLLALSVAALAAIRWRSRRVMFYLSIASLLYFGFYRKGCVCPIGAIQNVAQALFDPSYIVPWVVIGFFSLPLIFALLFGRVFCAGVCPLGALQDLVLVKALRVPRGLDKGLGVLRYFYLAFAVLYAATGTAYVICEYDPFISFFRFSARFHIWILSAVILAISLFVGRPYCRYLCPYGSLLGLLSRFAVRRTTITPDECVVCGLCADSCPFGAIEESDSGGDDESAAGRRPFLTGVIIVLALTCLGGVAGRVAGPALARMHYVVQVAERVYMEESQDISESEETLQSKAFRVSGVPSAQIYNDARDIRDSFRRAGGLFGLFCGFVAGLKIASFLQRRRRREEYVAEDSHCLACGRCYLSCPVEHKRLKKLSSVQKTAP